MSFRPGTFFGSKEGDDEWQPGDEGHPSEKVKLSFLEKKRKQPPRKATGCKIARKTPPPTPKDIHKDKEQAEPTRVPVAKLKSTFKKHHYTKLEHKRDVSLLVYLGFTEAFSELMIDQWMHRPVQGLGYNDREKGDGWFLSASGRETATPIGWSHDRLGSNSFVFFFRSFNGDWEVKVTINRATGAGRIILARQSPMNMEPGFGIAVAPFVDSILSDMFREYMKATGLSTSYASLRESDASSDITNSTVDTSGSDSVGDVARSASVLMDLGDSKPAAKLGKKAGAVYHDVI